MVTIKVAAEITGLTIKSIRHYEKIGLLKPSARSTGGYRLYSEEDIFQLQQIRFYRDLKFSLPEIQEIFQSTPGGLQLIFQKQLRQVERAEREYERIRGVLEKALASDDCGEVLLYEEEQLLRNRDHVAIVGLDLQNDFLEGGALPCKRIRHVIEPLKRLFQEARERGIPVIYICDSHQKGVDKELEIWEDHAIEGTWGAQIMDELEPAPGDYVIKKSFFNGFLQTDLQRILDQLRIGTILFVGWRTHVCVAQTAIEAFHRGYRVVVAKDGVDSTTKGEHEFGLKLLEVNYGIEMYPCRSVLSILTGKAQPGKPFR